MKLGQEKAFSLDPSTEVPLNDAMEVFLKLFQNLCWYWSAYYRRKDVKQVVIA